MFRPSRSIGGGTSAPLTIAPLPPACQLGAPPALLRGKAPAAMLPGMVPILRQALLSLAIVALACIAEARALSGLQASLQFVNPILNLNHLLQESCPLTNVVVELGCPTMNSRLISV